MTASIKQRGETDLTYELKWAAWRWLYAEAGCRALGFEVKLEGPGGRIADVVGVDAASRVYLVEVKTSRGDLLKDHKTARAKARLVEETRALYEAAEFTSQLLGTGQGAATALASEAHEAVTKKLEASERRLQGFSTKFHDPAYLRCADFHYIAAPHGLVWPHEMPPFWGLINERGETLAEAPPKQVRRVTTHILRNIAKANTRDLMKACGVEVRVEDAERRPYQRVVTASEPSRAARSTQCGPGAPTGE
jgi:hypothetical protein